MAKYYKKAGVVDAWQFDVKKRDEFPFYVTGHFGLYRFRAGGSKYVITDGEWLIKEEGVGGWYSTYLPREFEKLYEAVAEEAAAPEGELEAIADPCCERLAAAVEQMAGEIAKLRDEVAAARRPEPLFRTFHTSDASFLSTISRPSHHDSDGDGDGWESTV